jgi:hypothetical protein
MRVYTLCNESDIGYSDADYILCEDCVTMPMHTTYDRFGQSIGYYESCAWIEPLVETFPYGMDNIYVTDQMFYEILEDNNFKEGVDYIIDSPEVTGFNFWDGHNFKTAVLDMAYSEYRDIKRVDSELEQEILNEWEEKERIYDRSKFGCIFYESNKYIFIKSLFASSWYIEVYSK